MRRCNWWKAFFPKAPAQRKSEYQMTEYRILQCHILSGPFGIKSLLSTPPHPHRLLNQKPPKKTRGTSSLGKSRDAFIALEFMSRLFGIFHMGPLAAPKMMETALANLPIQPVNSPNIFFEISTNVWGWYLGDNSDIVFFICFEVGGY